MGQDGQTNWRWHFLLVVLLGQAATVAQCDTMVQCDLHGSAGALHIRLHREWNANACAHFLDLIRTRFYDGSLFYNVQPGEKKSILQTTF